MPSALITARRGYPALLLAEQLEHHRFVLPGPLVLGKGSLKPPAPTADRDRSSKHTQHTTPQNEKDRSIINKDVRHSVIVLAIATGFFLLVLYSILSLFIESQTQIQTIMFIAVSVDSIFLALSLKRLDKSIFHTNIFSNPLLIGAIGISVVILIIAFITPPLAAVLSLVPIPLWTLLVIPFSAAFHITIIEIVKVKFFKKKYAPIDKQVVMSGTQK